MALNRPWLQGEDRPNVFPLPMFGYGPAFFKYLFPLVHPEELSHLNTGLILYGVEEAHIETLNRWVELGIFGLASHFILLAAVASIGLIVILGKGKAIRDW